MIVRFISALVLLRSSFAQDDLIVNTSYGSIQGYEAASSNGKRVRVFKSVPFAAPPVGDLRWKLPTEPKKWDGVKDGTKYSAACMSNSTTSTSPEPWVDEDCLYLNVFIHGECSPTKKCNIVVYLHGGGMNFNSATYFDDKYLIENYAANGVMLVIPAFRLGFTGQFSLGDNQELVPSNLGVYDAIQALKFIKNEAAAFGGGSDAITLMGHSFGGALSIMLGFSPVRKLQLSVHNLIMMSPGFHFDPPEIIENLSKEMMKRAGKVTLSCMKQKSGLELLAIQRKMEEDNYRIGVFGGVIFHPPLFPFTSISEMMKNQPNANILIGSTTGEMDQLPMKYARDVKVGPLVGAKNVKELDDLYFNLTESGMNNQTHKLDSQDIYVAVYITARAVMDNGNKAFVYSYEQPTHNTHTDDLSYLMGVHGFERDENEQEIAKFYPKYFLNFSKYGEPSSDWKPMNLRDRYLSIKVNLTTGRMPELREFYEKETIEFWVEEALRIDKMITLSEAERAKIKLEKVTGDLRDLILQFDSNASQNDTLISVLSVHTSLFPSFLLICAVFLFGMVLGRYLLTESSSNEERMRILGPDAKRMQFNPGKVTPFADKIF